MILYTYLYGHANEVCCCRIPIVRVLESIKVSTVTLKASLRAPFLRVLQQTYELRIYTITNCENRFKKLFLIHLAKTVPNIGYVISRNGKITGPTWKEDKLQPIVRNLIPCLFYFAFLHLKALVKVMPNHLNLVRTIKCRSSFSRHPSTGSNTLYAEAYKTGLTT